jgi:hypothetical protein
MTNLNSQRFAFLVTTLLLSLPSYASCGSTFCHLNTNWDIQGVWDKPGIRLDLRAEYIQQDQPRAGTRNIDNAGFDEEEKRTINRNYVATLDYAFDQDWGVTVRVPFVIRSHSHILNDTGTPQTESWNFSGIGDAQVVGRFNFFRDETDNAGLRFGLKLPTGAINETNMDGMPAERALQPGTGSVDGIVGAYYNHRVGSATYFVQVNWQSVIHARDEFSAGRQLGVDLGLNYAITPKLSALLQLNIVDKARDQGANAEPDLSGARYVSISPGLTYRMLTNTQIYGLFQQPIYQNVNGLQLSSDWSAAVGLSTQF